MSGRRKNGQDNCRVWRTLDLAVDAVTHEGICADLSGRDTTWREHLTELYRYPGVKSFTGKLQQDCITHLLLMATRTDKGILLAEELRVWLRHKT